jgi:hypothetical protein
MKHARTCVIRSSAPRSFAVRSPAARALVLAMALTAPAATGCGDDETSPPSDGIVDASITAVSPAVWLPGTTVRVRGGVFVSDVAGSSRLRLRGTLEGQSVDLTLPAGFADFDELRVAWQGGTASGMPADEGRFEGEMWIEAHNSFDDRLHRTSKQKVSIELRAQLEPRLDALQNTVLFVNDDILVQGDGFLLGGDEGDTLARVEGCFTLENATDCTPVGPTEVRGEPLAEDARSGLRFPFSPHIAGILPGSFDGSVTLVNRHGSLAGSAETTSGSLNTANEIVAPTVFSINPSVASLGQFVDVAGGGFVGLGPGESDPLNPVTTVELDGTFTPEGGNAGPTNLTLVTEFVDGQLVRYVVNEEDELGQAVDLWTEAGVFVGNARPVVQFGSDSVTGNDTPVTLELGHVKQVVWVRFLPSYVESLTHFGLRALDTQVRERVMNVLRRDYAGVNIEFREERPDDFKLYAEVEIGGPDPNGIGLLGYDNTPGKDDGNRRLYDRIGGVNALTQLDGYPGFGGVFVESLFSFSQHPGALAKSIEGADASFDQIFDPFRPDSGGKAVAAGEVSAIPQLLDPATCPAPQRPQQAACAVVVLGSLIGTTVSHEVAHSLGLADPGGSAFHNQGDFPNALMDAGGARSFQERAELGGLGPSAFCQHNYDYLRIILPTSEPDPLPMREDCF